MPNFETIPQKEILDFIKHFSSFGEQVVDCFSNGNCFWFAEILRRRFPNSYIVYNSLENHFACSIDCNIYDITGVICHVYENQSKWYPWRHYIKYDPTHAKRIQRDCIRF